MYRGTRRFPSMDRVVYDIPVAEALAEEIRPRDSRAVYVMASGTLARETDVIDNVRHVLGNRLTGVCSKIGSHTPRATFRETAPCHASGPPTGNVTRDFS